MARNGNPFGLRHSTPEGKLMREKFADVNKEKLIKNYSQSWNKYYNKSREEIIKDTYK
jgi:hypothetical protein